MGFSGVKSLTDEHIHTLSDAAINKCIDFGFSGINDMRLHMFLHLCPPKHCGTDGFEQIDVSVSSFTYVVSVECGCEAQLVSVLLVTHCDELSELKLCVARGRDNPHLYSLCAL